MKREDELTIAQQELLDWIRKYIEEFGNSNPKRYRGYKTMRDFLLNLSKDLHIQQKVKITEVKPNNDKIFINHLLGSNANQLIPFLKS